MDGDVPQSKKNILLEDVEFGLGGIMLGGVFFLIVFLVLNYFNILSLSSLYPNQLGFLPHRPFTSSQSIKQPNQSKVSEPIVDKVILKENASKLFLEYINNVIAEPVSQSNVDFKQDAATPNNFSVLWQYKQATASALFTTAPNRNDIVSLQISIPEEKNTSPSVSLAKTTASQFFSLKPKNIWKCKPLYEMTYCENFWEENSVKKGLSVAGPMQFTNGTTGILYSLCEHAKEATNYSWKSCTIEFAKTGVQ